MWAPIPAATPPLPLRLSSSVSTASWRKSPPWPPYSSGYFSPRKPSSPIRVNTSLGNQRAFSHSVAFGRSSLATKRRIDSRSSSCSGEKGFIAARSCRSDEIPTALPSEGHDLRERPLPLDRPVRAVHGRADDRARRHRGERRAALDPGGSRLLA